MYDLAMAIEVQRQLVLTGLNVKTLEPAVEVVDPASEVAVDEHLGFTRRYLELQRRFIVKECGCV